MQKIVFSTASDIYEQMKTTWKGSREYLLAQVIRLVEKYIESDKLRIDPPLFNQDDLRRRIIITLHMSSVAEHLKQAIHFENTEALFPSSIPKGRYARLATCFRGTPESLANIEALAHQHVRFR